MPLDVRVETSVGHDRREPSDTEVEVAYRIGQLVEAAVQSNTAMMSLNALQTPKKYAFSLAKTEEGAIFFVTVWVDCNDAHRVLWDIIMAAKTTAEQQVADLLSTVTEGEALFTTLGEARGLRPATPSTINEFRLD